jgi:hypothetical protein
MLKCNKQGQTGETISWVIATLVIIGILIIFLYISSTMAVAKKISIGDLITGLSHNSLVLTEKTAIAHQLAGNKNKEVIDKIILDYDKANK